jgi:hypothetical protein
MHSELEYFRTQLASCHADSPRLAAYYCRRIAETLAAIRATVPVAGRELVWANPWPFD